mgnify:CR=1 FL=1
MDNHNHNVETENPNHDVEDENNVREPWNFWIGLLVGLLTGGLAGAVAALLLAPQSGKRTRTKLLRQGDELRQQAAETVEDAMAQARTNVRHRRLYTSDPADERSGVEPRGRPLL